MLVWFGRRRRRHDGQVERHHHRPRSCKLVARGWAAGGGITVAWRLVRAGVCLCKTQDVSNAHPAEGDEAVDSETPDSEPRARRGTSADDDSFHFAALHPPPILLKTRHLGLQRLFLVWPPSLGASPYTHAATRSHLQLASFTLTLTHTRARTRSGPTAPPRTTPHHIDAAVRPREPYLLPLD